MNQFRKLKQRVDGVLLLDKPKGLTSNAALQTCRRLFNAAKGGHTGTLDPLATGLLPLCFGEATKFTQTLLDADKTYEAVIQLGVTTDTCDAEGRVLKQKTVAVSLADLTSVLARFAGVIEQVPPMYSALKRDGQPLYKLARQGIEIERVARQVEIHALQLRHFDGAQLGITVSCSKGTYIRTLAADIGEVLGCGAHLAGLRRTRIGPLDLSRAVTLEKLESLPQPERDALLFPADTLLDGLPRIDLDETAARRFNQGQTQPVTETPAGLCRVYGEERFMGVGQVAAGLLAPQRVVAGISQAILEEKTDKRL